MQGSRETGTVMDEALVVGLAAGRERTHRVLTELDRTLGEVGEVAAGPLLPAVADDLTHELLAAAERIGAALERLSVAGYLRWTAHAVPRSGPDDDCAARVRGTAQAVRAAGQDLTLEAHLARQAIEAEGLVRAGWTVRVEADTGARLEDRVYRERAAS